MDLIDLRRLLTQLVMPLPMALALVISGGVAMRMLGRRPRLRRAAAALSATGVLLLWVAAMPWTAQTLMARLEATYPPRAPASCGGASKPVDAIILLGGAVQPQLERDYRGRLHRGSDRIREAALLLHAGCAPRLLVSAGGGIESPAMASEADAIRVLLAEWGVPMASLIIEDHSRTTEQNARYSRQVLAEAGPRPRILLVSSAWHLRRAVSLFEREGFAVLPVGADYRSLDPCAGIDCWLPHSGALDATGIAWKEYLGYWVHVRS